MSEKEVKYDEDGIVILDDEPTESADYTQKTTSSYGYNMNSDEYDDPYRGRSGGSNFKVYNLGRIGGLVGSLLSFLVILLIFVIGFILFKIIGFIVWYFFPVILVYIVWKLYLKK